MATRSTLLKALLRQRHWQTYGTFCRQYDAAAREIDAALVGRWPSHSQFARWLAGDLKGLPHADHCRALERMFPGLTAAQLFARDDAVVPIDIAASAASLAVAARSASTAALGRTGAEAAGVPSGEVLGAARQGGQECSLYKEITMATEESARFVRRTRGAVDADVLDQLAADVRQLAVDYLARPPFLLFRPLAQLRREVFELLDERQRPAVLPPLYRVAGQLCALLAHASADLGQAYAAETHTRTAWLCADIADDDPLRAYVRWVQSNVAYWAGDYRRAAELAQSGQRHATSGTSLLRLASQEARAWAACREDHDVERALAVATAARDQDPPDNQPGVFRFEPGKAAYYASEVRLALGGADNYRLAAAEARKAIDLFASQPDGQRCAEFVAAAQLDLANAHLALDDLDAAGEHLRPVLRLPVESRTQPIVGRAAKADDALGTTRYARSPLAGELREQIALFRGYTASREPPTLPP